ncbi:uncharacterized protein LOC102803243 [Saccoglossus kowalevskii]
MSTGAMANLSDEASNNFTAEYTADLRASMWKSVKEDRERLLFEMGEYNGSNINGSGDGSLDDFDLDTLRTRRTARQKVINLTADHSPTSDSGVDTAESRKRNDAIQGNNVLTDFHGNLRLPDKEVVAKDTPRTKQLKDLRSKRLAYFEKNNSSKPPQEGEKEKKTPRKKTPRSGFSVKNNSLGQNKKIETEVKQQCKNILHQPYNNSLEKNMTPDKLKRSNEVTIDNERSKTYLSFEKGADQLSEKAKADFGVVGTNERTKTDENDGSEYEALFEHSVDPVIDLRSLQIALKNGDEGLRKYLQEVGRKNYQDVEKSSPDTNGTVNGAHNALLKSPKVNSPRTLGEIPLHSRFDQRKSTHVPSSFASPATDERNLDCNFNLKTLEKHSPSEINSHQVGIDPAKQTTKVSKPTVTSSQLESYGLFSDLFSPPDDATLKLNNDYENANFEQNIHLAENGNSAEHSKFHALTADKDINLQASYKKSSKSSHNKKVGQVQISNEFDLDGDDEDYSDIELTTHVADFRPVSPLKEVKINAPLAVKESSFSNYASGMESLIDVEDEIKAPPKPAGVPSLELDPSTSSEDSDHVELIEFSKGRKKKKSHGKKQLKNDFDTFELANSLSDFTEVSVLPRKVNKTKQRVIDSELWLSLDSNMSEESGIGKYTHIDKSVLPKGPKTKPESATKKEFVEDANMEELVLSTHRPSSSEKTNLTRPLDVPNRLPHRDPMNKMYDDWLQDNTATEYFNIFLQGNSKNDDLNTSVPTKSYHLQESDVQVRQPTSRTGVSVEDFLTGIQLQKSTSSKGLKAGASVIQSTDEKKPFERGDMITKAASKIKEPTKLQSSQSKVETYKSLEKHFSDVEKKLAELGLEHLIKGSNNTTGAETSKSANIETVKICPECDAVNREHITWCLECGCVLIGIEPEPHPDIVKAISRNYATELQTPPLQKDSPQLIASNSNEDVRDTPNSVQRDMPDMKTNLPASPAFISAEPVSATESSPTFNTVNAKQVSKSTHNLTAYEKYLLHVSNQQEEKHLEMAQGTTGHPTYDAQNRVGVVSKIHPATAGSESVKEADSHFPRVSNGVKSDIPVNEVHPLFEKLLHDPRVQPKQSDDKKPRPSSAGPQKSVREIVQPRPSSSGTTQSKTRQYIEQDQYKRHWSRSSTAWDSYNKNELCTWSSMDTARKITPKPKPTSAKRFTSVSGKVGVAQKPKSTEIGDSKVQSSRPKSASTRRRTDDTSGNQSSRPNTSSGYRSVGDQREQLLQSPRGGHDVSLWQLLPDELLLTIFSYLSHKDLAACTQVCLLFNRICRDETLWKQITLEKKSLCNTWLEQIGKKHPVSLSFLQCQGDNITSSGLRSLFRSCSDSLQELNISGCSQGELTGDSVLLHVTRCPNLKSLDASWCNVTDNAVMAVVDSSHRLETMCLNGCQSITDEAVFALINKHSDSLEVLELFGCFNITANCIIILGSCCRNLDTLNLANCSKLTDACISQLALSLSNIEHLDLRGCKQIKDTCIRKIVRNCHKLRSLVLANCPLITDNALVEIATYLPTIRSLDLSGCKKISNTGVRSIAMSCHGLIHLDVSSTRINHKSVSTIACYCNKHLETLKLSFCSDITEASVIKLAKNCRKLRVVHLYGVRGLRRLSSMNSQYKFLIFE